MCSSVCMSVCVCVCVCERVCRIMYVCEFVNAFLVIRAHVCTSVFETLNCLYK